MSVTRVTTFLLLGLLLPCTRALADSEVDYIKVQSASLDREMSVGVYLPSGYDKSDRRYPVVYFLHGMFGSERKWESRGIPQQLDELISSGKITPMIVVCPNGENSMYVNWVTGKGRWKDYIVKDLVAEIDRRYRTVAKPEARGISGDSMGGYGALNIAFHHPGVFGSVSAHSAAIFPVDPDDMPDWAQRNAKRWGHIFGNPVDLEFWKENNPLYLAETLDEQNLKSLAIYFDCGTRDRLGLDVTNSELSTILEERKIDHQFKLRDGGHGREYFSRYAPLSLTFHAERFAMLEEKVEKPAGKDV